MKSEAKSKEAKDYRAILYDLSSAETMSSEQMSTEHGGKSFWNKFKHFMNRVSSNMHDNYRDGMETE